MNKQQSEEVAKYIDETPFATLAYVRADKSPILRSMGSFTFDGVDLFFSCRKDSRKVTEIEANPQVSFHFQHDQQSLSTWKSILLIGEADLLGEGTEYDKAVELLSIKNPRFKERAARGELVDSVIYKIKTREIEYVDYARGFGFVEKFKVNEITGF